MTEEQQELREWVASLKRTKRATEWGYWLVVAVSAVLAFAGTAWVGSGELEGWQAGTSKLVFLFGLVMAKFAYVIAPSLRSPVVDAFRLVSSVGIYGLAFAGQYQIQYDLMAAAGGTGIQRWAAPLMVDGILAVLAVTSIAVGRQIESLLDEERELMARARRREATVDDVRREAVEQVTAAKAEINRSAEAAAAMEARAVAAEAQVAELATTINELRARSAAPSKSKKPGGGKKVQRVTLTEEQWDEVFTAHPPTPGERWTPAVAAYCESKGWGVPGRTAMSSKAKDWLAAQGEGKLTVVR